MPAQPRNTFLPRSSISQTLNEKQQTMARSPRKRARSAGSGGSDDEGNAASTADDRGCHAVPASASATADEKSAQNNELPPGPSVKPPVRAPSVNAQQRARPGGRRSGAKNFTTELKVRVIAAVLRFVDDKKREPTASDLAAIMDPVRATASPAIGRLPERFDQIKNILRGAGDLERKALCAFEQVEANPRASMRFHILAAYHPVLCVMGQTLGVSVHKTRSGESLDPDFIPDALERVDIEAAVQREAEVRARAPGAVPAVPAPSSSPPTAAATSSAERGPATGRSTKTAHSTYAAGEAIEGGQGSTPAASAMGAYSAYMEGLASLASLQHVVAQGVMLSSMMTTWFATALADPRGIRAFARDTPLPAAGTALLAEGSSVDFARSVSESLRAVSHVTHRAKALACKAQRHHVPRRELDRAREPLREHRGQLPGQTHRDSRGDAADTASSLLLLATAPAPMAASAAPAARRDRGGESRAARPSHTKEEA